jgi:mycothiol synthase
VTRVGADGVQVAAPDPPPMPGLAFRTATPNDWDAMAEIVNRARQTDGIGEVRTGQSLADEFPESEHFELPRDVLLAEVDGGLAGYVIGFRTVLDDVLTVETFGAVAPEHRRCGIGTALWQATRARQAAECAADPRPGPREMRAYTFEVETGDIALLEAMGYVPIRYGFEMYRSLTGQLPDNPLPPGLEMRSPVEAEYRKVFDADTEAFADHWGHHAKTDADFRSRFYGVEADPSLYLVAWDGDEVAGVVMSAIFAEENEVIGRRCGWLERASVRRPWRGRGIAKALMSASMRLLRDRGMEEAWLGVDGSNPTGALQLHEGLGFKVARRWQAYGRPLERPAPSGWRSGDG